MFSKYFGRNRVYIRSHREPFEDVTMAIATARNPYFVIVCDCQTVFVWMTFRFILPKY